MDKDKLSYGSDQSGLIYGYIFHDGKAGELLHTKEILAWLSNPAERDSKAFLWAHFNLGNSSTLKWLRAHTDSPQEFYEILHQGSRSTRIEHADDFLIAVVNDVLHDFSFDPSEIATLWLNLNSNFMISARRKPLKSVDHLRDAVNNGEIFLSPAELLTHLLRDQADVLTVIVRNAITKIDDVEDLLFSARLSQNRAKLGELRRLLVRLQRLLAPEPAALFRLLQKPPVWMAENDVQELRQSTEEFSVVLNDMASLQERIKLLQEELAAHVAEQNNRSLFVLTIVTVLALPINITAGLMGMNVGGIPFSQDASGFWIILAFVAAFTIVAGLIAFNRRNHDD